MNALFSNRKSTTLACFSPPVILVSFLIEAGFGLFALWKYRKTSFGRLAATMLFFLAGFQMSELFICGGASAEFWTRFGYICTAFLPAFGIDFIERMTGKRVYTVFAYASALAFSVFIMMYPDLFQASQCTGKFVAFQSNESGFDITYSLYYLTAMFLGTGLAIDASRTKKLEKVMHWLVGGYAAFILPTFVVYAFYAVTLRAFSSVLCGFAVLLALVLSAKVLPLAAKVR